MVQVELQPSPETMLPSSHCSAPAMMPSPHALATHFVSGVGHCHPGSSMHVDEQPSPDTALPSSHVSLPVTLPSPHLTVETHGASGWGQTKFASSWHSELQPSPETVLPSSHCSPMSRSTTPSPQNSIFLQAVPAVGHV